MQNGNPTFLFQNQYNYQYNSCISPKIINEINNKWLAINMINNCHLIINKINNDENPN